MSYLGFYLHFASLGAAADFSRKCQEGVSGSYDDMLTSSVGFQNPGNVKYLSEDLGLGSQQYSNFSALRYLIYSNIFFTHLH